jgi:hypothetical protein
MLWASWFLGARLGGVTGNPEGKLTGAEPEWLGAIPVRDQCSPCLGRLPIFRHLGIERFLPEHSMVRILPETG